MKTCCFIGHRKLNHSDELFMKARKKIEDLIAHNVSIFLFGSNSQFNDLCWQIVTDLKEVYPHLLRIYLRAEYEYIHNDYADYILKSYDKTYFATNAHNAGRLAYIKRNEEMINESDICFFYYNKTSTCVRDSHAKASGTALAFAYALQKHKTIINLLEDS